MAIETTFTIKSVDVDSALKDAENKAERSAKKIDQSLNSAGKGAGKQIASTLQQASKGMDAVAKSGSKAAGTIKNLAGGITGLMSPIGIVAAGITAVIAGISKMASVAKAEAEALLHSHEWNLRKAQERAEQLNRDHSQERSYMQRLSEINNMEHADNATKQEALVIIDALTRKYGDLGISINDNTGKIEGLTNAMQRLNNVQKEMEMDSAKAVLNSQVRVLSDKEENVMPRNPRVISGDMWGVVKDLWDGLWSSANRRRDVNKYDILRGFGGPMKEGELMESFANSMAMQGTQGMVNIESPIYNQRMNEAYQRYYRYYGGNDEYGILPEGFKPDYEPSEKAMEYANAMVNLAIEAKDSSGEARKSYEEEVECLQRLLDYQRKLEVAYEMQDMWAKNDDEAKKWREIVEELEKYHNLLLSQQKMIQESRKSAPDIVKPYRDENQKVLRQIDSATDERANAYQRKYKAEETLENVGATREELYRKLETENNNYEDQIIRQTDELKAMEDEYKKLEEAAKAFDQYKNDKGIFTDKGKEIESYEAEKRLNEAKLRQVELETQITNAQTEQLNIQAKMKQYEQEMAKERQERLREQMKKVLGDLWSNVLGDYKERTNALTARGGYLRGVNTATDPAQVNRQILNTVLTSNNYLVSIRQAIQAAGNI